LVKTALARWQSMKPYMTRIHVGDFDLSWSLMVLLCPAPCLQEVNS
jgi:hypothetical protein